MTLSALSATFFLRTYLQFLLVFGYFIFNISYTATIYFCLSLIPRELFVNSQERGVVAGKLVLISVVFLIKNGNK